MDQRLFETVSSWIQSHGRPLEKARLHHLFGEGDSQAVLTELKKFQNPDGGIGHGLEPDCWNVESSPIQTWTALEIIREIKLENNDPFVRNIIDYFWNTPLQTESLWYATQPSNNHFPHAPWWHFKEESKIWAYNPTAAVLGFLYRYGSQKERGLLAPRIQKAIDDFLTGGHDEMHELRAFVEMEEDLRLADYPHLSSLQRGIEQAILNTVEHDPEKWFTTYCVRPLHLIDHPDRIGYSALKEEVQTELDMLATSRNQEGVWNITWQWGQYDTEFEVAKKQWMGIMALGFLKIMKNFEK